MISTRKMFLTFVIATTLVVKPQVKAMEQNNDVIETEEQTVACKYNNKCESLHKAAAWGCIPCLEKHLKNTPIDKKDAIQWTALLYAAMHGRVECFISLLNQGANLEVTSRFEITPLMLIANQEKAQPCVEAILTKLEELSTRDKNIAARILTATNYNGINAYGYGTNENIKKLIKDAMIKYNVWKN